MTPPLFSMAESRFHHQPFQEFPDLSMGLPAFLQEHPYSRVSIALIVL